MIKSTARSEQLRSRSGNFSTHSSHTGNDLLGLGNGEEEKLTPAQEIEVLRLVRKKKTELIQKLKLKKEQSQKPGECAGLGKEIRKLNVACGQIDRDLYRLKLLTKTNEKIELGQFILEIFKERTPKIVWQIVVKEAQARYDEELRKQHHDSNTI